MANGRVERSQNYTLGRVILDQVLLLIRVKQVFGEDLTLIKEALLTHGASMLVISVQSCAIAVSKGMLNVVTLLFTEEVDLIATIFGRHPWVLQDLIYGEADVWVSFQNLGDQIFRLL